MKNILRLLIITAGAFSISCGNPGQGETAGKDVVYTPGYGDSAFMARVLSIYDAHVLEATGNTLPVPEAYKVFMADFKEAFEAGPQWEMIYPGIDVMLDFWYDFLSGWLHNNLAVMLYNSSPLKCWYYFPSRGMHDLVKAVAENNPFWEDAVETLDAARTFTPTSISKVIHFHEEIDYSNDLERFLVAYILMPDHVDNENLVLHMDVEHNRQVRQENEIQRNRTPYYDYDYKRTD